MDYDICTGQNVSQTERYDHGNIRDIHRAETDVVSKFGYVSQSNLKEPGIH